MAYNHFDYIENIAKHLKAIGHSDQKRKFYRSVENETMKEVEARISSASGIILIAVDSASSDYDYPDGGHNLNEVSEYFFIIAKQTSAKNVESVFVAQKETKALCAQVIAKMMEDYVNGIAGLLYLDPSSITIRGIGPLGSSFHGCIVGFSLVNTFVPKDPEQWV